MTMSTSRRKFHSCMGSYYAVLTFSACVVLCSFQITVSESVSKAGKQVRQERSHTDKEANHNTLHKKEYCLRETATVVAGYNSPKSKLENLLKNSAPEIQPKKEQQIIGCIPGDLMIGAFFPVHKQLRVDDDSSYFLKCSSEINFSGILAIEILDLVLREIINTEPELFGFKIGAYIFDHCESEIIAQHHLLRLAEYSYLDKSDPHFQDACQSNMSKSAPLVGIVFEMLKETQHFYSLLNSLKIPHVDNRHITVSANDIKNDLQTGSRNIYDDNFIVFYILNHFRWTYISLIYSEDYHDLDQFGALAQHYNICIAKSIIVHDNHPINYYGDIVRQLAEVARAKIIVSFVRGEKEMAYLLHAMKNLIDMENHVLISSVDWIPSNYEFFKAVSKESKLPRILIFRKTTELASDVESYKVHDDISKRNPWLKKFIEENYNCTFDDYKPAEESLQSCMGKQLLLQDPGSLSGKHYLEYIFFDTFAACFYSAYIFDRLCNYSIKCTSPSIEFLTDIDNKERLKSTCIMKSRGYEDLTTDKNYLMRHLAFEILSNEKLGNQTIFVPIGLGQVNENTTQMEITMFEENLTTKLRHIKSKCSDSCSPSQKKIISSPETPCCWACANICPEHMIVNLTDLENTDASCTECLGDEWPNENQTACEKLQRTKSDVMNDPEIVTSLLYSVIIIILTIVTIIIFVKHQDTPVVRSSTKELSFLMLFSIIIVNSIVFIKMIGCSQLTCSLIRIVLTPSFATIYGSLLVKTVRIARLLALSKDQFPTLKMRFMSTKALVIITAILTSVQILIVITGILLWPSQLQVSYKYCGGPRPNAVTYVCGTNVKISLFEYSFLAVLLLLCTACAVWTRNVPDNFNEAKYIGFSMYSTCITWLGFWLIYFNTDFKTITLCLCASTNSLIVLVLLFFPKIYIIIWKPKKNDKRYFRTSKDIRAHVGNIMAIRTSQQTK